MRPASFFCRVREAWLCLNTLTLKQGHSYIWVPLLTSLCLLPPCLLASIPNSFRTWSYPPSFSTSQHTSKMVSLAVCVYVCVCERQRDRDFQMLRFLDVWKKTRKQVVETRKTVKSGVGDAEGEWGEETCPHIRESMFLHPDHWWWQVRKEVSLTHNN